MAVGIARCSPICGFAETWVVHHEEDDDLGLERTGDSIARRERWLRTFERIARRRGGDPSISPSCIAVSVREATNWSRFLLRLKRTPDARHVGVTRDGEPGVWRSP